MRKMLLIFSHELTEDQEREAASLFGCNEIITLPAGLQERWSNVDPSLDDITGDIEQIIKWISGCSAEGDYLLVEGDFGMTFAVVSWALSNNRIPVYSTTGRDYSRNKDSDGSVVNIHRFRHVKFRHYVRPV
jgi:hypothetical protein